MNISVVSYLNSAPLVHGILHSGYLDDCNLTLEVPAAGAARLASGEADVALVPVGAFMVPDEVYWIGNYCIGVEGPVRTVGLFSQVPLDRIRKVWLDPHSRTSVRLIRILATFFWKMKWEYLPANEGFEQEAIQGDEAGVCIGDKVFGIEGRYPFFYDLAEEWVRLTGLPFVFAAWAAKKTVPSDLAGRLDLAQAAGIASIEDVAREYSLKTALPECEIRDYLTRNISYGFTENKKKGMKEFFRLNKILTAPGMEPSILPS
jgi:chorismate dehydratase